MGGFACRDCCEVLRRAASQGQAAARDLNQIACLLQDAVSRTDDIRRLLQTDKALEQILSQVLRQELALIRDICG